MGFAFEFEFEFEFEWCVGRRLGQNGEWSVLEGFVERSLEDGKRRRGEGCGKGGHWPSAPLTQGPSQRLGLKGGVQGRRKWERE